MANGSWLGLFVVAASGCCNTGQGLFTTEYVTGPAVRNSFSVKKEFGSYFCVQSISEGRLTECSYTGDKNLPDFINCPQDLVNFTNVKTRALRDCSYGMGGAGEIRWVNAESGRAGPIIAKNDLDTGVMDGSGYLCFRSDTGITIVVEQYLPNLECLDVAPPQPPPFRGGFTQQCTVPTCSNGTACSFPNSCVECQYGPACLPPNKSCESTCGSTTDGSGEFSCDTTANCLRCTVSASCAFPAVYFCAAPGKACCYGSGPCNVQPC
jgi:hypothetical protein